MTKTALGFGLLGLCLAVWVALTVLYLVVVGTNALLEWLGAHVEDFEG